MLTGTLDPLRNLSTFAYLHAAYNRLTGTLDPLRNLSMLESLFVRVQQVHGHAGAAEKPLPAQFDRSSE
ncbi:hypothetical protein AXG93_1763s1000 [Marchantia polymorpha subsp. ruderalis]|uniref:Leucine-rich repeat-containing N-terminal plant-type domain-containing protein n=1 Tax=Marchantia polymorpha subsp. ruderalis TaxID=1480154 RepID=A0A176WGT4_MARPO|nr:hypothetical protein AXG93_1763s1000 [Marchantia polymorpha subsp. ruderalis]